MKLAFFSDPHLGLTRAANTAPESAARLRQRLTAQAHQAITLGQQAGADWAVCGGDLFDAYSNSEVVLQQALQLLDRTQLVLAGNHDLRNAKDSLSSLQLLASLLPKKFILNEWGDTEPTFLDIGNTRLVMVPHMRSQEDFELALDEAITVGRESFKWNLLLLHCNVEMEGRELSSTTLNLSTEQIHKLLLVFHRVMIGHEHNPRDLYQGRVQIIGNTYPTGFTDLSDKRILVYDTEAGTVESLPLWTQAGAAWQGKLSELPETMAAEGEFLDLTDDLEPGEAYRRVVALFKGSQHACAIRLRPSETAPKAQVSVSMASVETLPSLIEADLQKHHAPLVPLWKELLDATQAQTH